MSDAQRELDAWDAAERAGTRSALEGFVSRYPDGRYTPRARVKLAGMAPAPVAAPAPAPAPRPAAHNPQAEFEVWDGATSSGRRADYEAYLSSTPTVATWTWCVPRSRSSDPVLPKLPSRKKPS